MLISGKKLLQAAAKKNYCVGAYNVNNMEQIQAIMQAARETQSPVILQASRGALKYSNLVYLKHLMLAANEENPQIPLCMHLDHGNSLETVKTAISLGFTSVMIDGSLKEDGKTPESYENNVKRTSAVVKYAHARGVSVEGELGTLGGIEDGVGSGKVQLTDPKQAADFVKKTGIDSLAVAVGTSHGAYKFKKAPKLALHIVKEIHQLIPNTPLVMHGSSSVPQQLITKINRYGGKMLKTMGVPMASIKQVIPHGVRKVNVDTDGRLVITATIREIFAKEPQEFDPRSYLGPARAALAKLITQKMRDFGTSGHASDFR